MAKRTKKAEPAAARRIEYMPLADVRSSPKNPKQHDLATLQQSVSRFGYVEPLIMDERTGTLVAGHGRLELLRIIEGADAPPDGVSVGADGKWAVPVQRGWASADDAQHDAYLIASNRLVELGGWDEGDLAELLHGVAESGALEGVGYDAVDLKRLLAALPENVEFESFDESAADDVKTVDCPKCGEKVPV